MIRKNEVIVRKNPINSQRKQQPFYYTHQTDSTNTCRSLPFPANFALWKYRQNSRARIFVKTDRSCDRDTTMLAFKLKLGAKNNANRMRGMVGGMVQNSTNQNHYQHQQPICSSTVFFYINNKIRPTSTINIIINIRNMPNSTTKESQNQQKFLFSSTTICLTSNIAHRLQRQNTFNNLGTNDWLWSREVGTQKF